MSNSKIQVGTKVQTTTNAELTTSSSHNAKPHVVSSFCPSTMPSHASTYAAHVMLQQIEQSNQVCSHWLLMSLNKLLIERPNLSVRKLIAEIEILCPKAANTVTKRLIEHGQAT